MNRLFVGCKVRVVYSRGGNLGKTGRIVAIEDDFLVSRYGVIDRAYNCITECGESCWGPGYCYETIQPDGHRPAEQGSFEPLDHLLSRLRGVEA